MRPPHYFESVRSRAAKRWDQLESDPELAGPWHLLFKQVQSPRHVLSELLQNADDARATTAFVDIKDDEFVFTHNGEDFTKEHFTSLCRFGYSNKRALHTIGFRGVGFKSTFSLGEEVKLLTPSLSVLFQRQRFTQPIWAECTSSPPTHTEIRVAINDEHRRHQIEKNLQEWLKNSLSLLFFRHLRRLQIGEHEVEWVSTGQGPVPNSAWMELSTSPPLKYLLVRSPEQGFPAEALDEIRQERMLSSDEETDFPPCQVEIVLGMKGRLFVILPTGVDTPLPFACNAPFIQDPARVKIKEPETSPTNRWLLQRAGELAGETMLAWLRRTDLDLEQRAKGYGLFPDVDREDSSLEGACATAVEEAFDDRISEEAYLLAEDGELKEKQACVALPVEVFDIWSADQATAFLDKERRPALCRHVSGHDREKLCHWNVVTELKKADIIAVLESSHPPKPQTWRQMLSLWVYIATGHHYYGHGGVRIVPAQGKEVLYAAKEVVRLGEKKLLQSKDDWEFLAKYLLVLNQNWLRFLADQRRNAEERGDPSLGEQVKAAYRVLDGLRLQSPSEINELFEQVATGVFGKECSLVDCVKLAQISAALGAAAGEHFKFVTRDRFLRGTNHGVIFDKSTRVEGLVDEKWAQAHMLHPDYSKDFRSCAESEWTQWISSGRAGLLSFVPLRQVQKRVWGRSEVLKIIRERGFKGEPYYRYVTNEFSIDDWDFDGDHWVHWREAAKEDPGLWGHIVSCILSQAQYYGSKRASATVSQIATTGSKGLITHDALLATWILKLSAVPCLQDTHGFYHQPSELLCRTPETESLLDVEPFVNARLDTEANRPLLIKLGVRDKPTGPHRILDCLRALAKAEKPPVHEVEKWYRRLDQLLDTCSSDDFAKVKRAFATEKIILTATGGWARTAGVFIVGDEEDAPGAATVLPSVRDLTLWRKVSVEERPTADLAIGWLKTLPSEKSLSADESRRVGSLLSRYPERIWNECRHWLNLAGEWSPVETLAHGMSMQSLVSWANLFQPIKQGVADLRRVSSETVEKSPFSDLPSLASCIEDRFQKPLIVPEPAQRKPWLERLGTELCRIQLDNENDTIRIRQLAARLAHTQWQHSSVLETVPYIDGKPAGTARRVDVLWKDTFLYVEDRPIARLARPVAQELGRVFDRREIQDALKICFERSPDFVSEYLEDSFKLVPSNELDSSQNGLSHGVDSSSEVESGDTASSGAPVTEVVTPSKGDGSGSETSYDLVEEFDEDVDSEEEDAGEAGSTPRVPRTSSKPSKPTLIERFALALGYSKDGADRFYHSDGSWIAKTSDSAFPWERRSASGELLCYFWPKEHCLRREPLQVEADVWALCENFPELYALILLDIDGRPVEISGRQLGTMCSAGELTLHPATYRLVYAEDHAP